jgi:hypothetical protein
MDMKLETLPTLLNVYSKTLTDNKKNIIMDCVVSVRVNDDSPESESEFELLDFKDINLDELSLMWTIPSKDDMVMILEPVLGCGEFVGRLDHDTLRNPHNFDLSCVVDQGYWIGKGMMRFTLDITSNKQLSKFIRRHVNPMKLLSECNIQVCRCIQ